MANDTLNRDKNVLNDECKSLKNELDALKKRMADMDRENRKLAHEREELARAYKDADAGKLKALDRVAALEKELSKLKAEFDKKKSHSVTMTELQTKTRQIKELVLQSEEDRKNIIILQESLDKLNEKIKMYKRQLEEQEGISNANIMRVKKFQRELECAENRAEEAESTLNQFRSRERVFAAASARSEKSTDIQETEVVVKKTINKVNVGAASSSSFESSSSLQNSRDIRAGSTYSRAGSVARSGSVFRAGSVARAGSSARY